MPVYTDTAQQYMTTQLAFTGSFMTEIHEIRGHLYYEKGL